MQKLKLLILASAMAAGSAFAHGNEYLDTVAAPHGGQLRMAGIYHLELVMPAQKAAAEQTVTIYITDHAGKPVAVDGARATMLLPGLDAPVVFQPAGDNRLQAQLKYQPSQGLETKVDFNDGKQQVSATFTPFAKAKADGGHGTVHH